MDKPYNNKQIIKTKNTHKNKKKKKIVMNLAFKRLYLVAVASFLYKGPGQASLLSAGDIIQFFFVLFFFLDPAGNLGIGLKQL